MAALQSTKHINVSVDCCEDNSNDGENESNGGIFETPKNQRM